MKYLICCALALIFSTQVFAANDDFCAGGTRGRGAYKKDWFFPNGATYPHFHCFSDGDVQASGVHKQSTSVYVESERRGRQCKWSQNDVIAIRGQGVADNLTEMVARFNAVCAPNPLLQ